MHNRTTLRRTRVCCRPRAVGTQAWQAVREHGRRLARRESEDLVCLDVRRTVAGILRSWEEYDTDVAPTMKLGCVVSENNGMHHVVQEEGWVCSCCCMSEMTGTLWWCSSACVLRLCCTLHSWSSDGVSCYSSGLGLHNIVHQRPPANEIQRRKRERAVRERFVAIDA